MIYNNFTVIQRAYSAKASNAIDVYDMYNINDG